MVNNFPKIYDDELLYSVIARYHIQSGNLSYKKTLKEIFGVESIIATMEFNGHIDNFVKQLPTSFNINSEYLIQNHTLFPIYAPFLPEKRKNIILGKMKSCDGRNIKSQIGYLSGSVLKKEGIAYCPLCAHYELKNYGEAYIHRLHQVDGVLVCSTHSCFLKIYKVRQRLVSRLQFLTFSPSLLETDFYNSNPNNLESLTRISNSFKFLLENGLDSLNQKIIHNKYLKLLNERGLVVGGKRIRQRELYYDFLHYYGKEFLKMLNSYPEIDNEYNWLRVLTRAPNRVVHPLRQILFINFLCGGVAEFFNDNTICSNNSDNFNQGFPCLNPICDSYKKDVIHKYEMKVDNKTKNQIGTFYCECGFVYSRNMNRDIYSIGKIINYGARWESTLKGLIQENANSLRAIARLMHCDPKTVVKYADKFKLRLLLNSNMSIRYTEATPKVIIDSQKYKNDIITCISENPDWSRTQVRKRHSKEYMWLYKNDRIWLEEILPVSKSKEKAQHKNMRVNWSERDETLLNMLQVEYKRLIQLNGIPRITKSFLGRRINKLALLEKKLDKLPLSKNFLEENLESLEQFQKRRILNVLENSFHKSGEIIIWQVMRMAGLRKGLTHMVKSIIKGWRNEITITNREDTFISRRKELQ